MALMPDGGADGAQSYNTTVLVSTLRTEKRTIRARPGTFEWKFNRDDSKLTPLYHAGVKFAELWEVAGIAPSVSANMSSSGGGQWKGLPEGRAVAMDKIKLLRGDVGRHTVERLVDYCVMGTPSSEMASKHKHDERGMSFILYEDLRAVAMHFKYV